MNNTTTDSRLVCTDPRHRYLCPPDCLACQQECDKKYIRPATERELELFKAENDQGYEGVINSEHYKED